MLLSLFQVSRQFCSQDFNSVWITKGAVNISQNNVNYKFNTAIFGGGIYAKGSIVLDSKDGLFLRNYAAENGGALMLTSVS